MKFLKYIAIAAAALASLACQEVDKTCALPADQVSAPVLDGHSDIVVDADNLSSEVTFTWSAVDYGYHAAVSYALYCVYGESDPYQIGESYSTSYTLTKESLNNALVNDKGLAVPAEATSTVFLYVVSSISTDPESDYVKQSNVIAFDITTMKSTSAPWVRRPLWIRGNFTGWNDQDGPILWENGENSDVYEGLVFLGKAAGTSNYIDDDLCHFKFCPSNPGWDGNLGGDPTAMTTEGDPAHITAEEGLYWLSVTLSADHSTGSVKMTPVSAISVVGAYNGWGDDDVEMTFAGMPADQAAETYAAEYYAAMIAQTWECTIPGFTGGEFKFRLNHAWADSWGGDDLDHIDYNGANCSTDLTGNVRFTIDFHGDVAALAEDAANPSPVSATVAKVE
ncbi:MAG: SusE domain-containing protein [Alistipes sp.]|nr:SusE domain-containing protein [Alistipes senegalensis]MCM1250109.1 SusE domain-containing protein [Alistipes sp.]